jgi:hypothetical protein
MYAAHHLTDLHTGELGQVLGNAKIPKSARVYAGKEYPGGSNGEKVVWTCARYLGLAEVQGQVLPNSIAFNLKEVSPRMEQQGLYAIILLY